LARLGNLPKSLLFSRLFFGITFDNGVTWPKKRADFSFSGRDEPNASVFSIFFEQYLNGEL